MSTLLLEMTRFAKIVEIVGSSEKGWSEAA
jgi:flavin-binding protein dodecin